MVRKVQKTPSDFYRAQCAVWGEDEIAGWIDSGLLIVFDPVNGGKWDTDFLTNRQESARVESFRGSSAERGASNVNRLCGRFNR